MIDNIVMYGDDILSVVFLAFVCIVIAGVMHQLLPHNSMLIVPTVALISVSLWIAYDYMMLKRHSTQCKKHIMQPSINTTSGINVNNNADNADNADNAKELESASKPNVSIENTYNKLREPQRQSQQDFDIDYYNKNADIRDIHGEMGFTGDTRLCNRMKYMGLQPQLSKNIRASWNARILQPWVEEELREHEERNWLAEEEEKLYAGQL
jgi:hypothetical protein